MKWTISKNRIGLLAGALLVFFGLAFFSGHGAQGEPGGGNLWLAVFAAALGLGSLALLAFAVRIDPGQQGDRERENAARWSEPPAERLSEPERELRFEHDLLALAAALAREAGKPADAELIQPRREEAERRRE